MKNHCHSNTPEAVPSSTGCLPQISCIIIPFYIINVNKSHFYYSISPLYIEFMQIFDR